MNLLFTLEKFIAKLTDRDMANHVLNYLERAHDLLGESFFQLFILL